MQRTFNYDIMKEIQERWSHRAFSEEKISNEDINAIIEAARYAPSCFNEQPWRFIIASNDDDLKIMRSFLTEKNQLWANKAPVLIIIIATKVFALSGKNNKWNQFDAGTAWGYLSLEAQRRGLITHAMGGFNDEKARKDLDIPDTYDIIAMIAVGKKGDVSLLNDDLKKTESPGIRKPLDEIILHIH